MDQSQDDDLYLFNGGTYNATATSLNGQLFDEFLPGTPITKPTSSNNAGYLDPSQLNNPQEPLVKTENTLDNAQFPQEYRSGSASSSSQGSSSNSPHLHNRNMSIDSNNPNAILNKPTTNWSSGIGGLQVPLGEEVTNDSNMAGFEQPFPVNPDFEASNQQMASDFDFETAASTPSGIGSDPAKMIFPMTMQSVRSTPNFASLGALKTHPQVIP